MTRAPRSFRIVVPNGPLSAWVIEYSGAAGLPVFHLKVRLILDANYIQTGVKKSRSKRVRSVFMSRIPIYASAITIGAGRESRAAAFYEFDWKGISCIDKAEPTVRPCRNSGGF